MSRRQNHQSEGDREVTVDAILEADLSDAEDAVRLWRQQQTQPLQRRLEEGVVVECVLHDGDELADDR